MELGLIIWKVTTIYFWVPTLLGRHQPLTAKAQTCRILAKQVQIKHTLF